MTRVPIKLEDKHTRLNGQRGMLVDAFLCLDVPASVMADTAKGWAPLWNAGIERRMRLGLPPIENPHWNWSAKASWLTMASYRSLGVECEGVMQGLMLVITDGYIARVAPDAGKPIVYVDYVQTAPWNNEDLVDKSRFAAAGTFLMHGVVQLSIEMEYGGRVGLHSLRRSEGFYEKLGMTRVEIEHHDRHVRGLWYFEWTSKTVDNLLMNKRTP